MKTINMDKVEDVISSYVCERCFGSFKNRRSCVYETASECPVQTLNREKLIKQLEKQPVNMDHFFNEYVEKPRVFSPIVTKSPYR